MLSGRDEGPVYYREIQKNAYLKRIPEEPTGSKLRPLGYKKPVLKPMWTLFCVHNGRTPFLEQYPSPESSACLSHKPLWRACLKAARHVTASVKPYVGEEHDFLVDTEHGPVRMLAQDWDSMQDWVLTLRAKLSELKVLGKGENVYNPAPAPPPPRAASRDPTSPLPAPPHPPRAAPGILLPSNLPSTSTIPEEPAPEPIPEQTIPETDPTELDTNTNIDISNWESSDTSSINIPSTSQEPVENMKSVAKICGQNICLDDSILKRTSTDSDEEFFAEIDRISDSVENLNFENGDSFSEFKQCVVVSDEVNEVVSACVAENIDRPATNITVIQVSNKPPHTAIPVLGPETNVFNFDFTQKLTVNTDNNTNDSFVNIVNTEEVNTDNLYGTVFKNDSDYGHISLTTTVNVNGHSEGIYERLCMASTSIEKSPLQVRKVKRLDVNRKSSLPNLDVASNDSTYEYLFPSQNNNVSVTLNANLDRPHNIHASTSAHKNLTSSASLSHDARLNNHETRVNGQNIRIDNQIVQLNSREAQINGRETQINNRETQINNRETQINNRETQINSRVTQINDRHELNTQEPRLISREPRLNSQETRSTEERSAAVVERSHSQNAYDRSRLRDHLLRRVQQSSPQRTDKDKPEQSQAKPIWKRGLTELSLLSRLRGIGQGKRQESPTRQENDNTGRSGSSPVKVIHRSRPQGRLDGTRRRSSSLSNGDSPPLVCNASLTPLVSRQAHALKVEQRRGTALVCRVQRDAVIFADYMHHVWVAWCRRGIARLGDRVSAVRGATPRDATHARRLMTSCHAPADILFHRVPLAKIYVFNKRDNETLGIKLDSECTITSVDTNGPAAGLVLPTGRWAVTDVNHRTLQLLKGGEEEMNRISLHGTEASVLIQPAALVKKIRAAIKANKSLLSAR